MSTDSTTPEDHPAAQAFRSFVAKMRDMADAMEKADKMIYERLILGIPAEPEVLTVVRLGGKHPDFIRDGYNNEHPWATLGGNRFERRTWREVCDLATPEVLEPDSVKALREQLAEATDKQGFLATQRDRFRKAHDEMIEKYHAVCDERNAALSTLADVEEKAKVWAEKDDEPVDDRGLAILSTINRLGRELLHLLDAAEQTRIANGDDEPPALEAS